MPSDALLEIASITQEHWDFETHIGLFGRTVNLVTPTDPSAPREFQLSDSSGTLNCEMPVTAKGLDLIQEHAFVEAIGELSETSKGQRLLITALESTANVEPAVYHIPMATCAPAARIALRELVQLVARLDDPHLSNFLDRILTDPKIYVPYFSMASSMDTHHVIGGGNAVHCIHTAQLFLSIAERLPMDGYATQIGLVCSLLHDLGKVAFNDGSSRIFALSHDLRGLELMAGPLARLQLESPAAAEDVRFILNYRHLKNGGQSLVAEAVHRADVLSALHDAETRAFEGYPSHYRFAQLNNRNGLKRSFVRPVAGPGRAVKPTKTPSKSSEASGTTTPTE